MNPNNEQKDVASPLVENEAIIATLQELELAHYASKFKGN